ncbi:hypothetical protein DRO91_07635 [Candidatus Heimdallarchaeota archaeon]|nr:MAG: hypothetical protein DRO91_07635 [Candidatus Heimdallarchaeota archaeon]RLI70732.1 MAG: hypothetical protein DRP02_06960 [Candidatus Gerdarchaeota archaeon]
MTAVGNIDDVLSEQIKLKNPKIVLVEWLPFDRNQMSALNIKLDSFHRRRGHIVTAYKDKFPNEMIFRDEGISCHVIVKDFAQSEFVSFVAKLNYPEDEGIVQTEILSGYINSWGRVVYGAELTEVEKSEDGWVSLDVLTRIIVDLTLDTTKMIDSLLTEYQRNLLELTYMGQASKRTKYVLLLAEDISVRPEMPEDFLDGEELQNELEQILNIIYKVETLDDGYCFFGSMAIIAVTSHHQKYEQSLLERSFSHAIRMFLDDYSAIIWHLWDESRYIEKDIDKAMLGDITSLTRAQNWITRASSDAIMLHDILSYLRDSINEFSNDLLQHAPSRAPDDPVLLELQELRNDSLITTKRVNDTQKVIQGLESKMVALRDFSNALAEKHMRQMSDSMAQNQKSMAQMTESNNRASDALSIIELILAGSVIIEIVLMLFGEYSIPNSWVTALGLDRFGGIVVLAITVILWFLVFLFLRIGKTRLESSAVRRQRGAYTIGKKCNVQKLEDYLATKHIMIRNIEREGTSEIITVTFENSEKKNKKTKPHISQVILEYDKIEEFIIHLELETPDMTINIKDCFDFLIDEMEAAGVFTIVKEGEIC